MLWCQLLLHIAKLLFGLSMFISNRPSSLTWTWSARSRPTLPRQSGGQPTSQLQKLFGVRGRGWGVGVLKYPILLETWGFPLVVGWDAGRSEYFLNTPSLNWSQSPITNNHISQVVPGGLNWANNKQPTLPDLSLCSRRRICRHDP